MRATTSLHWGFPCSDDFLFHACRRHYPGGTVGCCRYPVQRRRPSPKTRRVGFRIILFEACSAFTRVPACMFAQSPEVTFTQSTSPHLLPPAAPWLLPAERPIGRVGFAPTENRRLSRHTGFSAHPRNASSNEAPHVLVLTARRTLSTVCTFWSFECVLRGRDAGYPAPPAQFPASGTTALGSYLGC